MTLETAKQIVLGQRVPANEAEMQEAKEVLLKLIRPLMGLPANPKGNA